MMQKCVGDNQTPGIMQRVLYPFSDEIQEVIKKRKMMMDPWPHTLRAKDQRTMRVKNNRTSHTNKTPSS